MVIQTRNSDFAETSDAAQRRILEEAEATRISAIVAEQVNRLTENHQAVLDAQAAKIQTLETQLATQALDRVNLNDKSAGLKKFFGKPSRFSGTDKNTDVREWLFAMKLILSANNETDETVKVAFCASYLDGKAKSHWLHCAFGSLESSADAAPTIIPQTLESFEKVMLAGFGHVDPVHVAWVKLEGLSQGMNDPPEYARQFQAVLAELGAEAPTGESLIQQFIRGLNPKLKTKVSLKLDGTRWKGEDLQALIRQCTAMWPQTVATVMAAKGSAPTNGKAADSGNPSGESGKKRKGGFNKSHGGASNAKGNKPNGKPSNKGKLISGPSGRELTREQIQTLKKAGKCFVCEQAGHRADECPKRRRPNGPNGKGKEQEN